ncbi:unnamed protein product [Bursaphelenchus okinawaensis]|uniref:Uncharacterized protein n=1 Tax=Bursaphelenchus okinawaensis TaxID=465554 RepID=A0A811K1Z3_9BILA|nr:unnamed protein product [Bursaphelenchus okinawaensis]CAG9089828.1 unnamed protein product [Bursaphelenchus okinawaensis]
MSSMCMKILAVFLCLQLVTSVTYYDVYRRMRSHEKKNSDELSPEWERYINQMSLKQLDEAIAQLRPYAEKYRKAKSLDDKPSISQYYPWIVPF